MSNSKAASKMLSRGSGALLESRNMVIHDCRPQEHTQLDAADISARLKSCCRITYLCIVVQLSGLYSGVTEKQPSDKEVIPGSQQVLVIQ